MIILFIYDLIYPKCDQIDSKSSRLKFWADTSGA